MGLTQNKSTQPIKTQVNNPVQNQCRAKAKEVAKVAYDDCMISAKEVEAELIRNEYKAKLAKLKSFYEEKIKKLNLKSNKPISKNASATNSPVITVLPKKKTKTSNTESNTAKYETPIPTVNNTSPVVENFPSTISNNSDLNMSATSIQDESQTPSNNINKDLFKEATLPVTPTEINQDESSIPTTEINNSNSLESLEPQSKLDSNEPSIRLKKITPTTNPPLHSNDISLPQESGLSI